MNRFLFFFTHQFTAATHSLIHITVYTVHSLPFALKHVFAKTLTFNLRHGLIWRL